MTSDVVTLDPEDWDAFRARAHSVLDAAIDKMAANSEGRVWTPAPEKIKEINTLETNGLSQDEVDDQLLALLPHGVGNTHPRFFGWVHGSGTPSGILSDMVGAAINANLGGRDHAANYVEKQVTEWVRQIFDFPQGSSGLVVSGTSLATLIALKTARDNRRDFNNRKTGNIDGKLVGYTSIQAHSCVGRTFDILGLGTDALRKIPVNANFEMDMDALRDAIAKDKAEGYEPFAVVGTVGAVNVGSIDDIEALSDIAKAEGLWLHIDGAFGATGILSDHLKPRLAAISEADSLAFDFHKWMHVNYDAGFILMRSEELHRKAFSERPDYLQAEKRGLAAGNPWPTEYGPELSRGFRALKVWQQLAEHGTEKLGTLIDRNCAQARLLAQKVDADATMERLAPVAMNICCFRFLKDGADLDALNREIVIRLQEEGIAAPSTTMINGVAAIRVNITNHRTQDEDLDILLDGVRRIGAEIA